VSELDDLYQDVILDHNRSPRNFGELQGANLTADGHNPLCGDRLHLMLRDVDGRIEAAGFTGDGCAISRASASLMTEAIRGKSEKEARALFGAFLALLTSENPSASPVPLGKLAAFEGVRRFPVRVKCAMLAWRTLEAALQRERQAASTE
jgi:nitrogen fixation NifU-like protein